MPLAPSGWKPGRRPAPSAHRDDPPTTNNDPALVSTVGPKWKNSALVYCWTHAVTHIAAWLAPDTKCMCAHSQIHRDKSVAGTVSHTVLLTRTQVLSTNARLSPPHRHKPGHKWWVTYNNPVLLQHTGMKVTPTHPFVPGPHLPLLGNGASERRPALLVPSLLPACPAPSCL